MEMCKKHRDERVASPLSKRAATNPFTTINTAFGGIASALTGATGPILSSTQSLTSGTESILKSLAGADVAQLVSTVNAATRALQGLYTAGLSTSAPVLNQLGDCSCQSGCSTIRYTP